jgi:hypothetical protein
MQTKDEVLAELMAEHVALKKAWGTVTRVWVPHDTRDQIVDFVRRYPVRVAGTCHRGGRHGSKDARKPAPHAGREVQLSL